MVVSGCSIIIISCRFQTAYLYGEQHADQRDKQSIKPHACRPKYLEDSTEWVLKLNGNLPRMVTGQICNSTYLPC